jgi:GNAT superfamily N-acetyltransferase
MDLDKKETIELGKDFSESKLFEDYYIYRRKIWAETDPDMLLGTIENARKNWQTVTENIERKVFACLLDCAYVGNCSIMVPSMDSPEEASKKHRFFNINVLQQYERKGIGTLLLGKIVESAMSRQVQEIRCWCIKNRNGFCIKHGGTKKATLIKRAFITKDADWQEIQEFTKPSPKNNEYSFEFFEGFPQGQKKVQFIEAYKNFVVECNKFKTDKDFDEKEFTQSMEIFEKMVEVDKNPLLTCFVRDKNGDFAGFTSIINDINKIIAYQQMTGITENHRGKGLGLRLKALASLETVKRFPEVATITTSNDDENRWMIDINEAMGYKVRSHIEQYRFDVEELSKILGEKI